MSFHHFIRRARALNPFPKHSAPGRHAPTLFLPPLFCALALHGCTSSSASSAPDPGLPNKPNVHKPYVSQPSPLRFTDVSNAAGVHFKHNNGAFGLKLIAETLGSGVAFIDYDGDGYQDLFLVNGRDWTPQELEEYQNSKKPGHDKPLPARPPHKRATSALFHNNGDGTFSDVTRGSGLEIEMQGMGACAGDYDNDGRSDLYVTGYGRNYLFHNTSPHMSTHAGDKNKAKGAARFEEVAQTAGVRDQGWSSSSAWIDYDRDGRLDLFVCHYIRWTPAIDIASPKEKEANYDGPAPFQGEPSRLYRNLGGGRFRDVSAQSGVQMRTAFSGRVDRNLMNPNFKMPARVQGELLPGKSLGVATGDFNNDGWPDLAIANDTQPTVLLENKRDGTFADVASRSGVAAGDSFGAGGGMGIDAADIDHSNRDSLVIAFYADQMMGLYHNVGGPLQNISSQAGLSAGGLKSVVFGCVFADLDLDGWPDILTANGHVSDNIGKSRRDLSYKQRALVFLNEGRKAGGGARFAEIGMNTGALSVPVVGRGLACADIDLDGDLDVAMTENGGFARLLRNAPAPGSPRNNAIRLVLQGTKSNRDAIGAIVSIQVGSESWRQSVKSGSSYLSQSELPLTFGLGQAKQARQIDIRWPSGAQTRLKNIAAGQIVNVREGAGLVSRKPFSKR